MKLTSLCMAEDLLTMKACPPVEEEFVDIFKKIKYSFCLLVSTLEKYMLANHWELNKMSDILPCQLTLILFFSGPSQAFHCRPGLSTTAAPHLCSPESGKSTERFCRILSDWLTDFVVVFSSSQLVKTTGGPELGASVVSPALTSGAVSLLQEHLTQEEKGLWTALGHNWTAPW